MVEARSAQQIWEAALGELQIQVNKPNYSTWLKKTVGLSFRDDRFLVGVPNTFVAEYLDKNQGSLIEKVLTGLVGDGVQVQFQVDGSPLNAGSSSGRRERNILPQQAALPLFNPKYTFDSFIPGSCNQLAYAAAKKVAENPGQVYNPLFIHGGPGLGKTHLLHAIGHAALANNIKALYVSAEQYTNDLMAALRENKTDDFHSKYRNVDMLLVDDIQFLSGKEKTGENFFHTFDELHNRNRQIAITSDRSPKCIPLLPARLSSRFEWGLVTDIQPPEFETRVAILQRKAEQEGVNAPADVLELIALQIQQNIRALEGSLNRVVAYAKLLRARLTPELAAQALKDVAGSEPKTPAITPEIIIEAVVDSFQITPSDLRGRKRDEATVLARQVAMYLIRQETNSSLAKVGTELGGRSPATVSHAYQKIAADITGSPSLRRKVFDIQQRVYASAKNGPG